MSTNGKRNEQATFGHETQLELKYCERCGGLWLREMGCGEVYCGNCLSAMNELPAPRKLPQSTRRVHNPRLPQGPDPTMPWDVDDIDASWDFPRAAGEL